MAVQLTFCGAAGTVTGSKYLLETARSRILIDCGLFQGYKELRERNWSEPPFRPSSIDAVVLTHAHTDHVGYLPRIVRKGFHGPVHASRATTELARIILEDGAKLQEEEARYRSKRGLTRHHPALPLYDDEDVHRAMRLFRPVRADLGARQWIRDDIELEWYPAGHLLGARSVMVIAEGVRILFSGDLGRWNMPILPDPHGAVPCDHLVIESTYGDREHPAEDSGEALAGVIRLALQRGGPLLLPSFAVGRTQDLLHHIRALENAGRIPVLPVRADSPMAAEATRVYRRCAEEHDEETARISALGEDPFQTGSMVFASTPAESKRINEETGTRIVIASSGMMTGGRVLHHASRILHDPKATLCIVGYQAAGTTGRKILDGATEVVIMKQRVPVRCRVDRLDGFSAHGDAKDLIRWMEPLRESPPKGVHITHGEPSASAGLRRRIRDTFGWEAGIPAMGDRIVLA
ncbi:MAG: MBL fold metallo-hydrolase RNA specificity domain-containing protein [Armatimonadota bacterium]